MDTLIDASYLHQPDQDYAPITSPFTWKPFTPSSTRIPKSYEEEPKLKTGDIVTIRPDLTTTSSTLKGQYKVISYNTINGHYGIIPVYSPFELPMYYTREELILVPPVNKEESFLYKVGDTVSFKLSGWKDVRYGQIEELLSAATNVYKIKDLRDACLYLVEESNIVKITYTASDCIPNTAELTVNTAKILSSAIKTVGRNLKDIGKIVDSVNEKKPLNIKIVKKQIKLNFKN